MRLENLDDGSKLEAAWTEALATSLAYFRALLSSSSSSAWKPVSVLPLTPSTTAKDTGDSTSRATSLGQIHPQDVVVHRRSGKTGEVYRAVVEVPCGDDVGVDTFRGTLVTPETRPSWDRMVQEAVTLDLLDAHTRVTKTNYRLGWPSSPRDAVTISKTFVDDTTLIDITTSLPRSRHEPAYLRPAPPYVRAHVSLLAWCVQLPTLSGTSDMSPSPGTARITCFWSWNPKGAWAVGGGVPQHMPSMLTGLVDHVREGSEKVPVLLNFGPDVSIGTAYYDTSRVVLTIGYAIVNEGLHSQADGQRRQIEFGLSSVQSWDVQIHVKTQNGEESPSTIWTSYVGQMGPRIKGHKPPKRLLLRFAHAALGSEEELVRVKVSIERTSTSATSTVRINGIPVAVEPMDAPSAPARPILEETASASGVSLRTMSTVDSMTTATDSNVKSINGSAKPKSGARSGAADKAVAALIKRNYIYFTSLLQEPEAKWRPILDSRGVAVHQLDSIDKTLVVFRAEAVFVGVGIWDLYSTIANPGTRVVWDKTHDESVLLEDLNELTDLWHLKSRAAWPVSARDSVMLRTTYKSPTSVHIFGFSVDSTDLFPRIPSSIDPTIIRTQIDLQGWSIEQLSPNTVQVTLVEQSDPRGWSNKSSIPQVMLSTMIGIGDFAIKHGAPPVNTRLGGAKALSSRYDWEKESYRFEYESEETRRSDSSSTATAFPLPVAVKTLERRDSGTSSLKSLEAPVKLLNNVECELRCDADVWSNSYDVVIDPPQSSLSALRRHRLSPQGGGLWLTVEHDAVALGSGRVTITMRRGAPHPAGKTLLMVNGTKIKLDVQDLPESDVRLLKRQKRARPSRAPLDVPPALGTIRKKQSLQDLVVSAPSTPELKGRTSNTASPYQRYAAPLARWYNVAAEQTRAAIVPMGQGLNSSASGHSPVDAAVRALAQLTRIHADRDGESTDPHGWQPVSDRDGLKIEKRILAHVSDAFPVYRAGRIIEGFTAEDVSAAISAMAKNESYETPLRLQSYGHGITLSHRTALTTFPFRSRSIVASTVVARLPDSPPPSPTVSPHPSLCTLIHATSSSFETASLGIDAAKYNPLVLPSGRIVVEGWIIETIDPYSHEQYAIPSTRCMYVSAVDYGGAMPLSANNILNSYLPRAVLAVEQSLKNGGGPSRSRLPLMMVMAPSSTAQGPWSLSLPDAVRCGLDERSGEGQYSLTAVLRPSQSESGTGENGHLSPRSPIIRHTDSRLSIHSNASTVIDLGSDIRRGKQDLIVAEIDLGSMQLRDGIELSIAAVSLPVAQSQRGPDTSMIAFKLTGEQVEMPFKCCLVSAPTSLLQSASLDPSNLGRRVLRVTLPTTGYDMPIDDPLNGRIPPSPRPRWLLDLLNDGAAVQIKLISRKAKPPKYRYAGQDIPTESDKKPKTPLVKAPLPQLVNRMTGGALSLEHPAAFASEYAAPVPVAPEPIAVEESKDAASEPLKAPVVDITSDTQILEPPFSAPAMPTFPTKRYSFWKYPVPRFTRTLSGGEDLQTAKEKQGLIKVVKLAPDEDTKPATVADAEPSSGTDTLQQSSGTIEAEKVLRPVTSLPRLIVACLFCLLLGSLLRSLLSEADFVIYRPPGKIPDGEHWKELKRLLHWRIAWNWDLIIAVARRR